MPKRARVQFAWYQNGYLVVEMVEQSDQEKV
jgi:hypothetical protein